MDFPAHLCRSTVTVKTPSYTQSNGVDKVNTYTDVTGIAARVAPDTTTEGIENLRATGVRRSVILLPKFVPAGTALSVTADALIVVTAGDFNGITYRVQGAALDVGGQGVMQSVPVVEEVQQA